MLVLERDNAGFHAQLGLIRDAVSTYYPADLAKPLLTELEGFDKLELQPTTPDISASLKQLESARHTEAVEQKATVAVDAPEKSADEPTEKAKKEGGKHE